MASGDTGQVIVEKSEGGPARAEEEDYERCGHRYS